MQALNMNPDRIHYVVWKFGNDQPEINIDGRDLIYSQLGKNHHGMQCNTGGDDERHQQIIEKCKQITELFREIESLNVRTEPEPPVAESPCICDDVARGRVSSGFCHKHKQDSF